MGKTLIITEKPSVAREYAAILNVRGSGSGVIENEEYAITWCVGHLVEMCYPEVYDPKYKKWNMEDLPFLPKQYKYAVIKDVKKQYDVVHGLMNRDDITKILYAGDSGREGEVILELIRRLGGVNKEAQELRVWIDSCTEEEILRGIREAKPIEHYDNLANAGIMRSIEDYAMGINFSRALSVKYGRMLNKAANTKKYAAIAIGRVMTCVLGMIVRREREIRDFKETPFFRVLGEFTSGNSAYQGEWKAVEGSGFFESPLLYKENGFKKKEDAKNLIDSLKKLNEFPEAVIDSVQRTTEKKKAPLLFNLAELQAECSKRFKISPDVTLQIVQELYEKKLTTYPRTDARVMTTAIAKVIVQNLKGISAYEPTQAFAKNILENASYKNIEKTQYTDDKKVTDHYAIIPTGQVRTIAGLDQIQKKVYDLIVRRFLCIFYPPAVYQKANIVSIIGKERFFTSVRVLKDPGYLEILQDADSSAENTEKDGQEGGKEQNGRERTDGKKQADAALLACISSFKKGDKVSVKELFIKEGKTSPPKRYTSGSMVLAMENAGKLIEDEELRAQIKGAGIGTSATRAEIINKLVRIGYINLNKKTQVLSPKEFGEMIYEVVFMTMPSMLNPEMTASWEKGLAGVEQGTITSGQYQKTLEDYVRRYSERIKSTDLSKGIVEKIQPLATGSGYEAEGSSDRHSIGTACPVCGGEIVTVPFGYGCANYKKESDGCSFSIGTIANRKLSEAEAKELIEKGETGRLRGFCSKAGKIFSARLKLEDYVTKEGKNSKRAVFDFQEPEESEFLCPKCKKKLTKEQWSYSCECGFRMTREVAGLEIPDEDIRALLETGKTKELNGFMSKANKPFAAALVMNEDGKISFQFRENNKK